MWKRLDHFKQADRRTIRNMTIGVFAFYGAVFFVLLGLVITNQSVGGWVTSGVQAEIMSSVSETAINPVQITTTAAPSDPRRADTSPALH
ncbi:MAG TPA: hypothetical protein VLN61_02055 [Pseudolabrys sp.]|nr:hypothetical protein [Pseudolabrys sp.]